MSEQVGASLVLAQMLLPAQSGASSVVQAVSAGSAGTPEALADPAQPVDLLSENPPVFAALLNEFANLELEGVARMEASDLIRVRVDTTLPYTTPATGMTSPDTGMAVPDPGAEMLAADTLLPTGADDPAVVPVPDPVRRSTASAQPLPESADTLLRLDADIAVPEPGTRVGADVGALHQPPFGARGDAIPVPPASVPAQNTGTEAGVAARPEAGAAAAGLSDAALAEEFSDQSGQRDRGGEQRPPLADPAARAPAIQFSQTSPEAGSLLASPSTLPASGPASGPAPGHPTPAGLPSALLSLQGAPAEWAEPLAQRLAGLATRGANTAEVRLHPPSLGQLEVRITLHNDQASISLASASPEVREALQQALPRLDSLLDSLGIELADTQITDREQQASDQEGGETAQRSNGDGGTGAADAAPATPVGLIDAWA